MTLAAFLTIAFLHLLAAISPGPAVIMAARTGVSEGLRTGVFLALGIGVGAVVWVAAPSLLWVLKIGGAAYLMWLAFHLWRDADKPLLDMQSDKPPRSAASAFRLGVYTDLANPKTAAMFSAIFIGTVPPATPLWVYAALLVVVFLNEALWCMLVARIFSLQKSRTAYLSLKSIIDKTFGGLLALLGVKIAAT